VDEALVNVVALAGWVARVTLQGGLHALLVMLVKQARGTRLSPRW
jgi:hypothetical protein